VTEALKLWVHFGDSQLTGAELTSDAVMVRLARRGVAASALYRGIEGFGLNRRIHAERFPDVSTDLPLVACAVDSRERIEALLDDVDRVVADGLVTLERAASPRATSWHRVPAGAGAGGRADDLLRARRARRRRPPPGPPRGDRDPPLPRRRRQRAALHSPRPNAPVMIISVGRGETLAAALPDLSAALERPLAMLEGVAQLKHDGERLEELPTVAEGERTWQAIRVYTRQSAQASGPALHRADPAPARGGRRGGHDDPRRVGLLERRAPARRPLRPPGEPTRPPAPPTSTARARSPRSGPPSTS